MTRSSVTCSAALSVASGASMFFRASELISTWAKDARSGELAERGQKVDVAAFDDDVQRHRLERIRGERGDRLQ